MYTFFRSVEDVGESWKGERSNELSIWKLENQKCFFVEIGIH